jgi:hypothetical protein
MPTSGTLAGDDLENDVIEVPPPMVIQAQPKLSADANVDKVTSTDEPSALVSDRQDLADHFSSLFPLLHSHARLEPCLRMDLFASVFTQIR